MDRRGIATATLVIMAGTLAASVVGFVRGFVVARYFGAGVDTDAFFAALVVSQVLFSQLIGGAITAVLIPSFSRLLIEDREDFWIVVRTVFVVGILLSMLLVGVLELAARPLMIAVASGFEVRVHALSLAVSLVRVLLPTLVFSTGSAVAMAALYALGRRAVSSFAPALVHAGIIAAAFLGASRFGITVLAVGALVGSVFQLVAQLPALLRLQRTHGGQVRSGRLIDFHHSALGRVGRLYLPLAGGVAISIAGYVVEINFKSHLPQVGGLSSMQYAMQVIQLPVGLVATALAFAVLPAMSREAGRESGEGLAGTLSFGMRMCLLLMAPAAIGLLVLATPVAALIFQRGQFTAADTTYTARALLGYAPQIVFLGINQLLIYAFYARHNTLIPMVAGAAGVAVYVIMAFALFSFGIIGLALAETGAVVIHTLLLLGLVLREIGPLRAQRLPETVLKVGVACAGMAAAVAMAARFLSPGGGGIGARLLDVGIPGGIGVLVYGGLIVVLGVEEVRGQVPWMMSR